MKQWVAGSNLAVGESSFLRKRAYLNDVTELLHDVDHRAVAGPVDLTENGPQLLHCLGSLPQLPAGHSWLLQHLHSNNNNNNQHICQRRLGACDDSTCTMQKGQSQGHSFTLTTLPLTSTNMLVNQTCNWLPAAEMITNQMQLQSTTQHPALSTTRSQHSMTCDD